MKFLNSSPSFSSCSSSTTSSPAFNATICNSKSATTGCLAGILRRILCYGSFPTYPSDHIIIEEEEEANSMKSCKDEDLKSKEKTEESATPSIVARLMGLDSIPDANLVNSQSTKNSTTRSKSMDSVDRFSGCDDSNSMEAQHRRVKSTHSFREMPTFLELENEDFFILSFENESKGKKFRSKGKKSEMGFEEKKLKRSEKCKNNGSREAEKKKKKKKKQDEEGKSKRVLKDLNGREILRPRRKFDKDTNKVEITKKKAICAVLKSVEFELSSDELSPVSVLDCGHQFLVHTSDQEDSSVDARRRRKASGGGKCVVGSRKKGFCSGKYSEMWGEICRLTEDDLVGSNWIKHSKGMWNHEGMGADFESQILGQLLDELVDQFADFCP